MSGLSRETRLQVMLDQDELTAIDDWRFKQRMPSRASAIRELLRIALQTETVDLADPSKRSQDFGIVGNGSDGDSEAEIHRRQSILVWRCEAPVIFMSRISSESSQLALAMALASRWVSIVRVSGASDPVETVDPSSSEPGTRYDPIASGSSSMRQGSGRYRSRSCL